MGLWLLLAFGVLAVVAFSLLVFFASRECLRGVDEEEEAAGDNHQPTEL